MTGTTAPIVAVPALELAEGMTLANGAVVLAADTDEFGYMDVATYRHGSIELSAHCPEMIAFGLTFDVLDTVWHLVDGGFERGNARILESHGERGGYDVLIAGEWKANVPTIEAGRLAAEALLADTLEWKQADA